MELIDYAKILQQVDGLGLYKDISECVRECIRFALANVTLDDERKAWVEAEKERNLHRRYKKRVGGMRLIKKFCSHIGIGGLK